MKRKSLLIALTLILGGTCVVGCSSNEQNSSSSSSPIYSSGSILQPSGITGVANPWIEVESIDKLDDAINVQEDFSKLEFKTVNHISATSDLAQIIYGDSSVLRIQAGSEAVDISGIYGAVASNYYSEIGACFNKYFEEDIVYAYWSNGKYVFSYMGSKGEDEKTVDETVMKIYNLYK